MRKRTKPHTSVARLPSSALTVGFIVLGVGMLYWAREILIPIALSLLLAFILAPIVSLLRKTGLGNKNSVLLTVILAMLLVSGIGILIAAEFRSLANELPAYQQNIRKKVSDLHLAMRSGTAQKVQNAVQDVMKEFDREDLLGAKAAGAVPVVVKSTGRGIDVSLLKSLLEPIARAGFVLILVIFMLIRREDLRDRFLCLAAPGHLVEATKAVDESGAHVSRYLLRQFLVNTTFGVGIAFGLWLIGLPYALLWGFIAGLCRFIPYAGPILGLASPILLSLAVFDGWTAPLLVIGLVACLEIITNAWVEPILYGKGIGVSEVALLVMIAFWTWLWGGIGLILAAPLTVCLMVISKSIPRLEFISLLLSRSPVIDSRRVFYQRLIAKHGMEAESVVRKFSEKRSRASLFEDLLLPTLIVCEKDRNQHKVTNDDSRFVAEFIRKAIVEPTKGEAEDSANSAEKSEMLNEFITWGIVSPRDLEELPLLMLQELLQQQRCPMRVLSAQELYALPEDQARPHVFCVGFLPGQPFQSVYQICQHLQGRYPEVPIVVGRWHGRNRRKTRERFKTLNVEFGWSLGEVEQMILRQASQFAPAGSPPAEKADASLPVTSPT